MFSNISDRLDEIVKSNRVEHADRVVLIEAARLLRARDRFIDELTAKLDLKRVAEGTALDARIQVCDSPTGQEFYAFTKKGKRVSALSAELVHALLMQADNA
jgi:hypothetical protein